MSQHIFYTLHNHKLTSVLMGLDKPLQGYFMLIDKPDNNQSDNLFWSNLIDSFDIDNRDSQNLNNVMQIFTYPKTLTSFLSVLEKFSIRIPQQMIDEVLADGVQKIGNKEGMHSLEEGIYKRVESLIF